MCKMRKVKVQQPPKPFQFHRPRFHRYRVPNESKDCLTNAPGRCFYIHESATCGGKLLPAYWLNIQLSGQVLSPYEFSDIQISAKILSNIHNEVQSHFANYHQITTKHTSALSGGLHMFEQNVPNSNATCLNDRTWLVVVIFSATLWLYEMKLSNFETENCRFFDSCFRPCLLFLSRIILLGMIKSSNQII